MTRPITSQADESFLDRDDQLTAFWETVRGESGYRIVFVRGPDGIGKTTLLHEFAAVCARRGITCAAIDFGRHEYGRDPHYLTLLSELWRQLGLGALDELGELVSMTRTASGMALPQAATPAPEAQGDDGLPGAVAARGDVIEADVGQIGAHAQAAVGKNIVQTYYHVVHNEDPRVVEPLIRKRASTAFQERLAQLAQARPVILLVDAWEEMVAADGQVKDPGAWLCDNVLSLLPGGDLPGSVAVIASAREPHVGSLIRHARRLELGPLPDETVRLYFTRNVGTELQPDLLARLAEISRGIPLAMCLMARGISERGETVVDRMPSADAFVAHDAIIGDAVEGFLSSVSESAAQAIRLGAIPHRFDRELLTRLCRSAPDFEQVLACPFVFGDDAQEHFSYHEAVRKHLLAKWRGEAAGQYRSANQIALAYFRELADSARQQGRLQHEHEREITYHLLIEEEVAGFEYLAARFEEACGLYALGQAQDLVEQAAELEAGDALTEAGCRWLAYFRARLDLIPRRGDAGEGVFKSLAQVASDPYLAALAGWSLGRVRVDQKQWSDAIKLYRTSLAAFRRLRLPFYSAQAMLALGDAYRNLADSSGGLPDESRFRSTPITGVLYQLLHLPYLVYERLARRISFLPNWYFGANYQDWIVAYLLTEAAGWYRQAEKQLLERDGGQAAFQAQLALAEIEHRLGNWARAHSRYAALMNREEGGAGVYSYRRAQALLGQGRTLADEGQLMEAESALREAVASFRHFEDARSAAAANFFLGRVCADSGQPDQAAAAYLASLEESTAIHDHLAGAQTAQALESLADRLALSESLQEQVNTALVQVTERHYIIRFPDRLLGWFRRLALLGALPITYALSTVIGFGLTLVLWFTEGNLALWQRGWNASVAARDGLILLVFAVLPILAALWLYRFLYTVMGVAVVYILGRRLVTIEREQPGHIICTATGLTMTGAGLSQTAAWANTAAFSSMHYHLRQHPIGLISRTLLKASSGAVITIPAITAGYDHLRREIGRRLAQAPGVQRENLDFAFFGTRWVAAVAAVVLAIAIALVYVGVVDVTWQQVTPAAPGEGPISIGSAPPAHIASGEPVSLRLTSVVVAFVPTLLLLYPAVTLWRLVYYRRSVAAGYGFRTVTSPMLWVGAIVATAIAVLWLILLPAL